jgi:zinc/manganese transport system permease protein
VIFVDIALAQAAALGTAVAVALGFAVGTWGAEACGLLAALGAAVLISLTRHLHRSVPQEAFIGIVYVVTAAAVVLLLSRLPHGGEEMQSLLVGSILWVDWGDVLRTGLLYAFLTLFLIRFRKQFWRVSGDPDGARAAGLSVGRWDFFFFAILGVAVTKSVQVAGVLLVFTLLVVPAVMAMLLAQTRHLFWGWTLGALLSIVGAAFSYVLDLPTGATIVCLFGLALVPAALFRRR